MSSATTRRMGRWHQDDAAECGPPDGSDGDDHFADLRVLRDRMRSNIICYARRCTGVAAQKKKRERLPQVDGRASSNAGSGAQGDRACGQMSEKRPA